MKLKIELDDPSRCYSPGETIRGHVQSLCAKGTQATVKVKCMLRGTVKWKPHVGQNGITMGFAYQRCTNYISAHQPHIEEITGSVKIPFAFQLPKDTPSSFNGKYGCIVYFIQAVAKRPRRLNVREKAYFNFASVVDLNTFPGAASPIALYKEVTSFSFFRGRSIISAKLNFPRSGFVGGQPLEFSLDIKNLPEGCETTNLRNLPAMTLCLMQKGTFKVNDLDNVLNLQQLTHENTVLSIPISGLTENAEHGLLEVRHKGKIPQLPPTGLGGYKTMDVNYYFKLQLDASKTTIIKTEPVIIGTIPLRENQPAPALDTATASSSFPSQESLPPTYQEAMLKDNGNVNHDQVQCVSSPAPVDLVEDIRTFFWSWNLCPGT